MENEIDITNLVVPKVANAVLSENKITFIYGWRDGGKSTSAFITLIYKCLLDKHFRFAHCRAKYNEIAGSTFQTLKDIINDLKLNDYFIITKDRFQIINKINPNNYFFGASADQPDKIRSTANLSGIIIDEAHDLNDNDFASLIGTLRENKKTKAKTKAIFIFNNDKVSDNHFIAKTFFEKQSNMYDEVERVMVNYHDNPFVNKDETEKKLLLTVFHDKIKYDKLMQGYFVKEENKSPWLYSWNTNKEKIVKDNVPYYQNMPLYLSFDFNNDPLSCIVSQHSSGNHNILQNPFINVLKEYQVQFKDTTQNPFIELCNKIKDDFKNNNIFVTGDASGFQGRMGLVAGSRNFYELIQNTFKIGDYAINTPFSNPLFTASRNNCNLIVHYHPSLSISREGCPNLINDCEIAEATDKNGKGDELLKDRKENKMDLFDALRYYFWTYFQNFKN